MTARNMARATIDRYLLAAHQLDVYLASVEITTDVGQLTRGDIEKFLAWGLEKGDEPTTVNGRYNALVQFFNFVAIEVQPEPYVSPMTGMKPPAFEPPKVAIIPDRILAGMLAGVEGGRERKTFEQIRDAAIIRLFMDTGARNDELTRLELGDLLDGDMVRLWGKSKGGGKVERHVPYSDRTGQALRRYLRAREHHPMAGSDRIWLGLRGPMTTSGVRQMIWKRSEKAGMRVHPHQFRHTFAHRWKKDPRRKDGDLKYLAGWRTDTMLHRYGKSADAERAQEAYRELGSPMEDL
jgi:integrase